MNYYGVLKLTSWFGRHLLEQYSVSDVRGNLKYSYIKEQLKNCHEQVMHWVKSDIRNPLCCLLLTS